jgi:hypothetical protein
VYCALLVHQDNGKEFVKEKHARLEKKNPRRLPLPRAGREVVQKIRMRSVFNDPWMTMLSNIA